MSSEQRVSEGRNGSSSFARFENRINNLLHSVQTRVAQLSEYAPNFRKAGDIKEKIETDIYEISDLLCAYRLKEDFEKREERRVGRFRFPRKVEHQDLAPGSVLIIDDEEDVRELMCELLEDRSIPVVASSFGKEGIDIFERHVLDISCVLLDLHMPDMNGSVVFAKLLAINPELKVIVMSGYREQCLLDEKSPNVVGFLKKPFLPEELYELMDRAGVVESTGKRSFAA